MTYAGPNLEDVQAEFLDGPCMAALGDSIQYAADGATFVPIRAYVDYADALRSIETGTVIEQDISVQALKTDIPVKPTSTARVTLGRVPGILFKPVAVTTDLSGTHWNFEVVKVLV